MDLAKFIAHIIRHKNDSSIKGSNFSKDLEEWLFQLKRNSEAASLVSNAIIELYIEEENLNNPSAVKQMLIDNEIARPADFADKSVNQVIFDNTGQSNIFGILKNTEYIGLVQEKYDIDIY